MALTPEQLAKLQGMINERREALEGELHQDAAHARDEVYSALAGPVTDTGDEAVADLLSDIDNAELSRDLRELREFEAAQARLADGSFGTCVDCGREIDFERLCAYPAAQRCFDCQRVHEKTYAHAAEPKL